MLMSTISRVLSAWFAFLLPCYSTFKVLSHQPVSEPDIQKWAMYWSVIGAFVAFEYLAEWLISWLPFYWELKTAFLLFLSLPQTQGSTYIYTTYLQPFFARNERDLDAGIVTIHRNVLSFIQEKLTALWELVWAFSTKTQSGPSSASGQNQNPAGAPMAWLFSNEVVRSAISTLHPSSVPQPAHAESQPIRSRHNSNVSLARPSPGLYDTNAAPPPFPVPQHFHQS